MAQVKSQVRSAKAQVEFDAFGREGERPRGGRRVPRRGRHVRRRGRRFAEAPALRDARDGRGHRLPVRRRLAALSARNGGTVFVIDNLLATCPGRVPARADDHDLRRSHRRRRDGGDPVRRRRDLHLDFVTATAPCRPASRWRAFFVVVARYCRRDADQRSQGAARERAPSAREAERASAKRRRKTRRLRGSIRPLLPTLLPIGTQAGTHRHASIAGCCWR